MTEGHCVVWRQGLAMNNMHTSEVSSLNRSRDILGGGLKISWRDHAPFRDNL